MDIFFLAVSLLIPVIVIIMGLIFTFSPPKNINSLYGYRTVRSMASQESWDAAHKIAGRIYLRVGSALSTFIVIFNLLIPLLSEAVMFIDLGLGLIGVIAPIFYVEEKLKEMSGKD